MKGLQQFCSAGLFLFASSYPVTQWQPVPSYPSSLSDGLTELQKAQLHEVADLMYDFYLTLDEMHYLDKRAISTGPHNLTALKDEFEKQEIDPAIIYLYSILPYVDLEAAAAETWEDGWLMHGRFPDFREISDVKDSRDPFYTGDTSNYYDQPNGKYIRPWVTPLTLLGNHGTVMLYDARQHHIWLVDQEGWQSTDRALQHIHVGWSQNPSKNSNYFEYLPSRDAAEVLRDISIWFRTLQLFPETSWGYTFIQDLSAELPKLVDWRAQLYLAHGWPNHFNGTSFEIGKARQGCVDRALSHAGAPLESLEHLNRAIKRSDRLITYHEEQLANAQDEDAKWVARYHIFKEHRTQLFYERKLEAIRSATQNLCPNWPICVNKEEMAVWELECIRDNFISAGGSSEDPSIALSKIVFEITDDLRINGGQPSDPKQTKFLQKIHQVERNDILWQAYLEAQQNVQQFFSEPLDELISRFGSWRDHDSRRIDDRFDGNAWNEEQLQAIKDWASDCPQDATKTQEEILKDINQYSILISNAQKAEDRNLQQTEEELPKANVHLEPTEKQSQSWLGPSQEYLRLESGEIRVLEVEDQVSGQILVGFRGLIQWCMGYKYIWNWFPQIMGIAI
jgi:hypothetical protein